MSIQGSAIDDSQECHIKYVNVPFTVDMTERLLTEHLAHRITINLLFDYMDPKKPQKLSFNKWQSEVW